MQPQKKISFSIVLTVAQMLGFWVQHNWHSKTGERHPFASVLPAGLIVATGAMLLSSILVRRQRSSTSPSPLSLSIPCIYVTVLGTLCFCMLSLVTGVPRFSTGRLVTIAVYLASTTPFVLVACGHFLPQIPDSLFRSTWFKRLVVAFAGLLVCSTLLCFVEAVSWLINSSRSPGAVKKYEGDYLSPGAFYRQDEHLGTVLEANQTVHSRLLVNDQEVWDVDYSTDSFGRRLTTPAAATASQFALFFGCSFLFGEGSDDHDTIPSCFSAVAPSYQSYNYGVPGYGPQQMLALLERGHLPEEIDQKTGIAIYLYLPEIHEARAIGEMDIVNAFAAEHPYYELNGDGLPVRNGSFRSGRPVTTGLYHLLGRSNFVRCLGLNFPRRTQAHYQMLSALVMRSRQLFLEQFPGSRFAVVRYPGKLLSEANAFSELPAEEYLDLTHLFDPDSDQYHFSGDGHPTPFANRALATEIASRIANQEE